MKRTATSQRHGTNGNPAALPAIAAAILAALLIAGCSKVEKSTPNPTSKSLTPAGGEFDAEPPDGMAESEEAPAMDEAGARPTPAAPVQRASYRRRF